MSPESFAESLKHVFKMEGSTTSRADMMKPVFLKAGVPLVLSAAGFIYVRLVSRKKTSSSSSSSANCLVSSPETEAQEYADNIPSGLNSPSPCNRTENFNINLQSTSLENTEIQDRINYVEEMIGLRNRTKELQEKEWSLEQQFLQYRDMKEQETLLFELRNVMLLELAHIECLEKEISSMESQNKMVQNMAAEHLRVAEQLEQWRSKNGLLQTKVKKLLTRTKKQSCLIREQNMKLQAREAEIIKKGNMLETRDNVIKNLDNELKELQIVLDRLQQEKIELVEQLKSTGQSASSSISKTQSGGVSIEDFNELVTELDQIQRERETDMKELTFLRWSNACLKHELMRIHKQLEQDQEENGHPQLMLEANEEIRDRGYSSEHEIEKLSLEQKDACLRIVTTNGVCSKRKRLMQKLKKWVEGNEKMKGRVPDIKHEAKCFTRHSVSEGGDEIVHVRRSCSSA